MRYCVPSFIWLSTSHDFSVTAVVAALQSPHAETRADVMISGLKAIGSLACDNAVNKAKLGKLGACTGACWSPLPISPQYQQLVQNQFRDQGNILDRCLLLLSRSLTILLFLALAPSFRSTVIYFNVSHVNFFWPNIVCLFFSSCCSVVWLQCCWLR